MWPELLHPQEGTLSPPSVWDKVWEVTLLKHFHRLKQRQAAREPLTLSAALLESRLRNSRSFCTGAFLYDISCLSQSCGKTGTQALLVPP